MSRREPGIDHAVADCTTLQGEARKLRSALKIGFFCSLGLGFGCWLENPGYSGSGADGGDGETATDGSVSAGSTSGATDPTSSGSTGSMSDGGSTTGEPTTGEPTTGEPTTGEPTTGEPTTGEPTTGGTTTGGTTTGGTTTGGEVPGPDICGIKPDDLVYGNAVMLEVEQQGGLGDPVLLNDGLTLVISQGGDLVIMKRNNIDKPFVGPFAWEALKNVNTPFAEFKITFSKDELEVYYSSDWMGPPSIWHASRDNPGEKFQGIAKVDEVTSIWSDYDPHLSYDGNRLYLAPDIMGPQHIRVAEWMPGPGIFSTPVLVEGVMSDTYDADPTLSRDELVMFFVSDRKMNSWENIYMATRNSIDSPFENVEEVVAPVNDPGDDRVADVFVAEIPEKNVCELYFVSDRDGGRHIYKVGISS